MYSTMVVMSPVQAFDRREGNLIDTGEDRVIVSCFCRALWKVEWWHGKNMVFGSRPGLEYQLYYFLDWQAVLPYKPQFS